MKPEPLNPVTIARRRADRFTDPLDRVAFLEGFKRGRIEAARDGDRTYLWIRTALDQDQSALAAGIIEGIASLNAVARVNADAGKRNH